MRVHYGRSPWRRSFSQSHGWGPAALRTDADQTPVGTPAHSRLGRCKHQANLLMSSGICCLFACMNLLPLRMQLSGPCIELVHVYHSRLLLNAESLKLFADRLETSPRKSNRSILPRTNQLLPHLYTSFSHQDLLDRSICCLQIWKRYLQYRYTHKTILHGKPFLSDA